ncbi:unnamed protein product [Arabidopsis thaliana]|uniref:Transmembrane protein n=1 Tax=Arabidopsis thaliana TaxID=3702 RepID=A0A654ER94_ARATH|nr:unnamed protein product [Arabidopsis thaliana]VYS51827.1 unnamed protein product [Arabidopsis thaliana]
MESKSGHDHVMIMIISFIFILDMTLLAASMIIVFYTFFVIVDLVTHGNDACCGRYNCHISKRLDMCMHVD